MSTYGADADLQLYLPAAYFNKVSSAQRAQALADASAEADAALGNRGTLPLLAPYPRDLIVNVCKLAASRLSSFTGVSTENGANAWIKAYRDEAVQYFDDVARAKRTPAGLTFSNGAGSPQGGAPTRILVASNAPRGWTGSGCTAPDNPNLVGNWPGGPWRPYLP